MTNTNLDPERKDASTGELVGQLSEQISRLVRDELALAQVELRAKGKRLGAGAALAGSGAVLAWFAVGALVCAAIAALALVVPLWGAALITAAVLLLIAAALSLVARKQAAEGSPPVPTEALAGTRKDLETVKEHLHR